MKGFLNWLFGQKKGAFPAADRTYSALPDLVFREDTTLPIVVWGAHDKHAPNNENQKALDEFWTAIASAWLAKLGQALGGGYTVVESERFLLLSGLDDRPAKLMLDYVEKTRRRILRLLENVASDTELGKVCIIVFRDADTYYRYVSNYFPEDGEFAQSGGMFIQAGYGHFVFIQADDMSYMEPTVAHELTHCLVQHLSIPAWLNEGLAVNTEQRFSPPLGRPLETPEELHEMHQTFWNADTIQAFWSGKSWLIAGDSNKLSYDLAANFVRLAASDESAFKAFVNSANSSDGGEAAALSCLGFPLSHLAQAVLGEGDWKPKPESWKNGVEAGQFHRW